jgi:hypothetical protein
MWYGLALALFSGPPKIRIREGDASASGEIDLAVAVQLVVWLIAAAFVIKRLVDPKLKLKLTVIHRIALVLLTVIGTSAFVSMAPLLTAVKAFQVVIEFFFLWMFVQEFGEREFFRVCFLGTVIMCAAIYFCWAFFPEVVVFPTELGEPRLRGLGIYEASHLAVFGIILLVCFRQESRVNFALLPFFLVLLIAALARADWATVALVLLLALIIRPKIPQLRWVYWFWLASPLILLKLESILDKTRELETLVDLSDRVGLWTHIISTTWAESPLLGTGFTAGTRLLGLEYNPELGAGHSIFVDVFGGAGLIGLLVFLCLCALVLTKSLRDSLTKSPDAFTSFALLTACLSIGLVGGELETTPFGFVFWGLVSVIAFAKVSPPEPIVASPKRPIQRLPIISTGLACFSFFVIGWFIYLSQS